MAAQKDGLSEAALEKVDETATSSLLYTLAMGSNLFAGAHAAPYTLPLNDKLFVRQSEVIRSLAEKESCVIIGRCADYVLRENDSRLSVFVYGDLECRKKRVCQRHEGTTPAQALDIINKTDRRRASYYNFYTGSKWGRHDNYHISVNSSLLGVEGTARLIAEAARMKLAEKENEG